LIENDIGGDMDRREPLVSIVMPIYNSETYLDEAILSIIRQTYKNWELLIINEFGSNEAGKRIIKRYASIDRRIKLIQNDERLGIAESLNVGLRKAKGEYIARMDGDDISLPRRIEKQVEFMEENKDILLCGVQVEVFGTQNMEWKLEADSKQIRSDLLMYTPCVHPTILFRRDVIDKFGVFYNKAYKASEDFDFLTRVLEFGDIANLKDILLRYRLYGTNATFVNNNIGYRIYSDVMERQFKRLGMDFTREEIDLISIHYSLKGLEGIEVLENMVKLDLLLKKIFYHCYMKDKSNSSYVFKTLHRRFKEAYDWLDDTCKNYDREKATNIYKNSVFYHEELYTQTKFASDNPRVSVLLPVYNSEKYIAEALWSVLEQTFSDFEVIILNEYGSNKESVEVINMFEDDRIRFINNEKRLGLGESLNLGIREAKGEYLARIDADDLARSDRFELQVKFLDRNKDYGLCGSRQHHFGINTDFVHEVPEEHDDIKAALIYGCEICHSTIMMRKSYFISNNLFYDNTKKAEDYELWTRAVHKFKFHNLKDVLGEYRIGTENITESKFDALAVESGIIAANNISTYLHVDIPKEHIPFLGGWKNKFAEVEDECRQKALEVEKNILSEMVRNNKKFGVYSDSSLLMVINRRWRWVLGDYYYGYEVRDILDIDSLFKISINTAPTKEENMSRFSIKQWIKGIIKLLYSPFKHGIKYRIRRQLWDLDGHLHDSTYDIKNTVWDIEGRLKDYIKDNLGDKEEDHIGESVYERINDLEVKINTMMEFIELKLSSHESITNENISKLKDDIAVQLDERVWKAEKTLGEQLDARVWKAEKALGEQLDARVWKAEKTIGEQFDGRIWKAECSLNQSIEDKLWNSNLYLKKEILSRIWILRRMLSGIEEKEVQNDGLATTSIYGWNFYEANQYGSFISAIEVFKYFIPKYNPSSIVDFGCGTGTWLAAAKQINRDIEVVGVDGDYVDRNMLMINKKEFLPRDLTRELDLERKFDLAMSLEVAEHLDEKYADVFVDTLCRHSDIILFSAAHLGQGGDGHINEQPIEYWINKFEKRDYVWNDIREIFKNNYDIEPWYKDNISLFIKRR